MSSPANPFALAGWRRTMAAYYAAIRETSMDPVDAAARFRHERDAMFRGHAESPIAEALRGEWRGLDWYPYDGAWCVTGTIDRDVSRETFEIRLASDGVMRCTRVGRAHFAVGEAASALAIYWLEGYGGGLWVPFTDATNGVDTYAGGRYLYDTIKGADLGVTERAIVLDFNYAYNPSCAYDARWSCPLSPAENQLAFAVYAGERVRNGARDR